MISANVEMNKYYETLKQQALDRNDKSTVTWSKYKSDLEMTKSLLSLIPKKITHDVMVPIGPKALMRGKIVHTNEFLVNLGETWFTKRTASQTIEICDRRKNTCVEMLEKLEKERELIVNKSTLPAEQEAFGTGERPEIIEYVTEEENEEWKKQHKIKEKRYREQLAELRKKEKRPIETEEDLWKHLEELELQEELEDELNRLNAEYSSEEDLPTENIESDSLQKQETPNTTEGLKGNSVEGESKNINSGKVKRKVSFACDLDTDDEPLRLEIRHSNCKPVISDPDNKEINSPADIYNHYLKLLNKIPFSVLKHTNNTSNQNNTKITCNDDLTSDDSDSEKSNLEVDVPFSTGVILNDVCEKKPGFNTEQYIPDCKVKKISKFKTSRKKGGF